MWYTYILRCSDNTLYTGVTNDIPRRITLHNAGKASAYTRALKREAQIKGLNRAGKLTLINP